MCVYIYIYIYTYSHTLPNPPRLDGHLQLQNGHDAGVDPDVWSVFIVSNRKISNCLLKLSNM